MQKTLMMARTQSNSSQQSDSQNLFNSAPVVVKQRKIKKDNQNMLSQSINGGNEFESSSQAESIGEYTKSGYHPVYLGEKFCNNKYQVIQKLGWGTFSTVWLIRNIQTKSYYAMKVQKSRKILQITAIDEQSLLKDIQKHCHNPEWLQFKRQINIQDQNETYCLKLIDKFPHFGMHGTHYCSTFEILGPTLLDVIKYHEQRDEFMDINVVKEITRQILLGLVYIHDYCKIIHTDIKPENIMFALTNEQKQQLIQNLEMSSKIPISQYFLNSVTLKEKKQIKTNSKIQESISAQLLKKDKKSFMWRGIDLNVKEDIQIKLVDFGNACWVDKHFTANIQTKEYRSPESIIEAEYDTKADMWSVGCLVFELLTNVYLFQPESGEGYSENDDHLAMIVETFGNFPDHFLRKGNKSDKYFDSQGRLKNIKDNLESTPMSTILQEEYKYDEKTSMEIETFLKKILQIDPQDRLSAREILLDPWLSQDFM